MVIFRVKRESGRVKRYWQFILLGFLLYTLHFTIHPPRLYGYTSLNSYYGWGDIVRGLSAASVGLGSTSAALRQDVASVFTNPACMRIENEYQGIVSLSPAVVWSSDKRDHSYLATSYTTDRNIFFQPASFGVLWSPFSDFVCGAGAAQFLDFDYGFEEESVRDRGYGNLNGKDTIDQSGNVFDYGLAANWQALKWLSLGFSGILKDGDITSDRELNTYGTQGASDILRVIKETSKLSGSSFGGGVLCSYKDVVDIGFAYRSGSEIKRKFKQTDTTQNILNSSSSYTADYEYPWTFSGGLKYNFRDDTHSAFLVDVIFSKFSQSRISSAGVKTDPFLNDVLEWHLGFEHRPFEGVEMRYGFSYIPSYIASGGADSSISAGCGFDISAVEVDIAGDYGWQQSTQDRIFNTSQRDAVYDTTTRLITTVRYKW